MVSVTTKYRGFVEKVHANYLGQAVRRGAPLFDVYAPELVQTQEELLSARRFAERLKDASPDARRRAEALVEAARRRLAYWDVSEAQVQEVLRRGEPMRTITVTSPSSGDVMMRVPGLEGMAVMPGMDLLHLADLSQLWLEVQLYEDQVALVRPGHEATVTFAGLPGESFSGRVRFVEPQVDERTRTATVTLEVPNPDDKLRVAMFAEVTFEPVVLEDAVLVPSQAVLRTGKRDLVVISLGGGRFVPREVVLGPEGDTELAVLAGLEAGEAIVLSSQFLLDSESRLREAVLKMVSERRAGAAGGE
jgi:Cu(I)/Ag(I) efflux system membrane fusion protein/cobalt-zinc-cadmium efflux system membrane fusion protein